MAVYIVAIASHHLAIAIYISAITADTAAIGIYWATIDTYSVAIGYYKPAKDVNKPTIATYKPAIVSYMATIGIYIETTNANRPAMTAPTMEISANNGFMRKSAMEDLPTVAAACDKNIER